MDWKPIRTVLLDMDGTLLDLHFDNWFWQELVPSRWGEARGMDAETAKRTLRPVFARHEGTLAWYCLDHWTRELDLDIAALKREAGDAIRAHPFAAGFLQALRALGKRVALVTNAHRTALGIKLDRTGIAGHFDAVYSSHDFGAPKETVAFWERLAEKEGFERATTLFADDSLAVLGAAREYGIGHLVAIAKPDSTRPARTLDGFTTVNDLSELMPS